MNILLDTCAFLWLARSPNKLSPAATKVINESSNPLFLSDASIWEVVVKHSAGSLPLPESPRIWIPKQVAFFQLIRRPVEPDALFLSGELPMTHRDPFDRLLAAQSIFHGLTVLTPDVPFSNLGAATLW